MRVALLRQYFSTPDQPGSVRGHWVAEALAAAGHQVSVITSDTTGGKSRKWTVTKRETTTIYRKQIPYSNRMSYARRLRSFADFAVASASKVRELDIDVIFVSSTPLTVALPGIFAKKLHAVPMVLEIRDLWPETPIAMGALRNPLTQGAGRSLERLAYREATEIIALSPGMAAGIALQDPTNTPITVVPNMADIDGFQSSEPVDLTRELGIPSGDNPVVLYAGTFGRVNNLDYLVSVAALMKHHPSRPRFILIGDGSEKARIESISRDLGLLEQNVFIRPAVPRDQLTGIILSSTVVCNTVIDHPSMDNNSANKFGDGLAAGRPILINYGGWHAELVNEFACGLALTQNPAQAASALGDFLLDRQGITLAGQAAHRVARMFFSRAEGTQRIVEVVERTAISH